MSRKKQKGKKGGEDEKSKKSFGPSGCGARAHNASEWNGERALKNAVISNGFLEAFLLALDAEDAGLHGLDSFRKLETMRSMGHQLVEHGKELANGKKQGLQHHRTVQVWEKGPAGWMTKVKELFISKIDGDQPRMFTLLFEIGERYNQWVSVSDGDVSAPYRRMKAVANKLDELGLGGSSALGKLEGETMIGKLPWLLESMTATELRKQDEESRKASEEASRKQAEENAKKLALSRNK